MLTNQIGFKYFIILLVISLLLKMDIRPLNRDEAITGPNKNE